MFSRVGEAEYRGRCGVTSPCQRGETTAGRTAWHSGCVTPVIANGSSGQGTRLKWRLTSLLYIYHPSSFVSAILRIIKTIYSHGSPTPLLAIMKPSLHLPLLLLPILPSVQAWGSLGHMTVAYLAEHLVAPRTELYMQRILDNPSAPGYLGSIATWADSYRYTKDGRYSAHLHYIDADDSPPWTCGLDIERDCADEFCIVSAIGNYVCAPRSPRTTKQLTTPRHPASWTRTSIPTSAL